ncbi:SOS response-associated peptidase family protein [Dyella telluris]|uniref:Abasic site processing protein n=1 Tax=Dyella telluris TaxID=2763498 RepID=A0A7G8Q3Z3_9GAMM|nr:SOS response-associated peptidase family protein [Dyella telluris]QNK01501.1 SOS response-associated peptidase family protein [Dyella telluris]
MCYSAEVWEDFRLYERMGGTLDIHAFAKMLEARRFTGDLFKVVPKAMREPFEHPRNEGEEAVRQAMLEAYRSATLVIEEELAAQTERLVKAEAVLASPKPTKKAETDKRVATNKIAAARERLEEVQSQAKSDGYGRLWPGQFAPLLIRDPATGARMIVPARYRCRLPGWTKADELEKPGTYNARKDKLHSVWKKLFGYNHGVIVARRFYESVSLHRLQHRELVPGERDIAVEVRFEPEPKQEMLLACLWRHVEPAEGEEGFYSFAVITRDPPPEVQDAGHDRCIIALKPEHVDAWLAPDPGHLSAMFAILDDPIDAFYEHAVPDK